MTDSDINRVWLAFFSDEIKEKTNEFQPVRKELY